MKNLMSFIVLATILVFTSCTKETITLPETDNLQQVTDLNTDVNETPVSYISKSIDNESSEKARITVRLQATVNSATQVSGEYIVNFAVNHDCTKSEVRAEQTIDFTDAAGKLVSLVLRVNSYTGSNGALQVVFDLGGHSLSGLVLKSAQDIVIEEVNAN